MKTTVIDTIDFEIINGHTYSYETGEIHGKKETDDAEFSDYNYVLVYINAEGVAIIESFKDIEQLLNSRRNLDLVYRYVAIKEDNPKFIIEDKAQRKVFIVRNLKGIGNQWTLYSNSRNNLGGIVARQEFIKAQRPAKLVGENLRFYCPYDSDKQIYLSAIQFTLKNTESTEPRDVISEQQKFFEKIKNTTANKM